MELKWGINDFTLMIKNEKVWRALEGKQWVGEYLKKERAKWGWN